MYFIAKVACKDPKTAAERNVLHLFQKRKWIFFFFFTFFLFCTCTFPNAFSGSSGTIMKGKKSRKNFISQCFERG